MRRKAPYMRTYVGSEWAGWGVKLYCTSAKCMNQRRLVTLARPCALSVDYPGQPAESAKPVHYILCAEFKINFAKIVTNLLCA